VFVHAHKQNRSLNRLKKGLASSAVMILLIVRRAPKVGVVFRCLGNYYPGLTGIFFRNTAHPHCPNVIRGKYFNCA
jgi:hypothetical protein